MRHVNQVITREQILEKIWGYSYEGETRTVDVHIGMLRNKLENHKTTSKQSEESAINWSLSNETKDLSIDPFRLHGNVDWRFARLSFVLNQYFNASLKQELSVIADLIDDQDDVETIDWAKRSMEVVLKKSRHDCIRKPNFLEPLRRPIDHLA